MNPGLPGNLNVSIAEENGRMLVLRKSQLSRLQQTLIWFQNYHNVHNSRPSSVITSIRKIALTVFVISLIIAGTLSTGETHPSEPSVKNVVPLLTNNTMTRIASGTQSTHHFTHLQNTGNNAILIVLDSTFITLGNDTISMNDEIGVFTPRDSCAGSAVWDGNNLAITVWGDDTLETGIHGFIPGEPYTLKLWDSSEQNEYTATTVFNSGSSVYGVNGISTIDSLYYLPVSPTLTDTISIQLERGWNQISSNILTPDNSVSNIMQDVQNSVVIMKNGNGEVFWPEYGIDQIDTIQITDGYQVKVDSTVTVQMIGTKVQPADMSYSLAKGWNLISFLGPDGLPPDSAVQSLGSNLVVMKDGIGNIYYPEYGIGTLDALYIGTGYWVNISSSTTFTYPPLLKPIPVTQSISGNTSTIQNTGNNATLLIKKDIHPMFKQEPLTLGDEIRVYNHNGLLVGQGEWENQNLALAIWGDDPLTDAVDGLETGESLVVSVWNQETTEEVGAQVSYNGNSVYLPNSLIIVDSLHADGNILTPIQAANPDSFSLEQNYPNPATSAGTTIPYHVSETSNITINIYDIMGQIVKTLVSDTRKPGDYTITWDCTNQSGQQVGNGCYIYSMQASAFRDSKKLIIIK